MTDRLPATMPGRHYEHHHGDDPSLRPAVPAGRREGKIISSGFRMSRHCGHQALGNEGIKRPPTHAPAHRMDNLTRPGPGPRRVGRPLPLPRPLSPTADGFRPTEPLGLDDAGSLEDQAWARPEFADFRQGAFQDRWRRVKVIIIGLRFPAKRSVGSGRGAGQIVRVM
jgi:hypothetical protein